MTKIYHQAQGSTSLDPVSEGNPFPVQPFLPANQTLLAMKLPMQIGWDAALIFGGYAFIAADADQNDAVTGQTSFASTTPTFMLRNPITSDKVIFPPSFDLTQAGTVAGAFITIVSEVDYDVYASSGTSERVRNQRYGMGSKPMNQGLLYSNPTTVASYGISVGTPATLAADVEPAEGVINVYRWENPGGVLLDPGSSLKTFTYAGTTGPTWLWSYPWYEIPRWWL